ncbi:MAG: PAS domain S-box protein [Thermodesulfobacteriota bacterium]
MVDSKLSRHEARQYAEGIISTSREPLVVLDHDLKVISASRSFYKVFKVNPEKTEGRLFFDLGNKYWDIPELRQMLETLLPQKTSLEHYEVEQKIADIGRRTMLLNAREIQRKPGKERLILLAIADITERKRITEAIENERKYLSAVIENIGAAIVISDVEGRINRFNEMARLLHGLPEKPVPSDQWARHYDLYQRDGITPLPKEEIPLFRALQGERVRNAEIVIAPKHSHPYFLVCNGQALTDETGRIYGAIVAMHDITERKQAEEALRESEQRFQTLLENLSGGIFVHDLDGMFLFVNEAACRHTGYCREELLQMHVKDIEPASVERGARLFWLSIETGQSISFDSMHIRKDGSAYDTEIHLNAINLDGSPAILRIAFDISARKQAEKKQEKLQAQLNRTQKMESIGRLAGGVAHDFNNMLSIINGYAELTIDMIDPEDPLYGNIREIYNAGKRSEEIVRQLLTYARKQTANPVQLDLKDTIPNMLKILQCLIGENIKLIWHSGNNLWPIKMDPSQLDQIMTNLAVNARDAISDVGKMVIETKNIFIDEDYCRQYFYFVPGEYVMLAVSDTGCGMEKEVQDNLFEPFFTTKAFGKGTGLGLATVYGIVKQNNGFINVYSEPGVGTTFKIYLPRCRESGLSPEKRLVVQIPEGSETVLLVEDEPAILQMGKSMLENLGYTVLVAGNPNDALAIAEEDDGEIDLLITDVVMPEMNGRDLASKISAGIPRLKTLFMSGYTEDVIAHHGVLDEGVYFIQKPFSIQDLAAKVREAIDQH